MGMDKEIKRKWLDALRSGDYTQGYGYLCRDTSPAGSSGESASYCCLGVLCEVVDGDVWEERLDSYQTPSGSYHYAPSEVLDKSGISNEYSSELQDVVEK